MPPLYATAAISLLVLSTASAQSLPGPPCQLSVSRGISFSGPSALDNMTISIGPGPCHSAQLTLVIKDKRQRILYRYDAPFKRHTATQWDEPSLPDEARKLIDDMARDVVAARSEVPRPDPEGQIAEGGSAELLVPSLVFNRLISGKQPVLYHPTYYEGGQYVIYDPIKHVARVVLRYGL